MSLNDYSISEYRDSEFFEHVFPLKKKVSDVASDSASETANLPASSSNVKSQQLNLIEARDIESKSILDVTLLLLS